MKFVSLFLAVASALTSAAATSRSVKLMFGGEEATDVQRKFLDYAYVTPTNALWTCGKGGKLTGYTYAPRGGYCWQFGLRHYRSSLPADTMLEHSVFCGPGTSLRIPFAGQTVRVHVWIGDWNAGVPLRLKSTAVDASVNLVCDGRKVYDVPLSPEWCYRAWAKGEDYVFSQKDPVWDRLVAPILEEFDFEAPVKDGAVILEFSNVDLTAVVVAADEREMRTVLTATEAERRAQFKERYPWQPQPDEPMPANVPADAAAVLFQRDPNEVVYPWSRPVAAEVTDEPKAFAARGEQEPIRFGVVPCRDFSRLEVEVGDLKTADGAVIALKDHADFWRERYKEKGSRAQSGFIASVRDLDPRSSMLADYAPQPAEKGTPRMYVLDVRVPETAQAGDYYAALTVRGDGRVVAKGRLRLKVMPFRLRHEGEALYGFQATYGDSCMLVRRGNSPEKKRARMAQYLSFLNGYGFHLFEMGAFGNLSLNFGKITGTPGNRTVELGPECEKAWQWWFDAVNPGGKHLRFVDIRGRALFGACGWNMTDWLQVMRNPKNRTEENEAKFAAEMKDLTRIVGILDRFLRAHADWPEAYWYFCGEIDNGGLVPAEYALRMGDAVRAAGAKSALTANGSVAYRKGPDHFDHVWANPQTPIDENLIARLRVPGKGFGCHNCGDDRFQSGFQAWRLDPEVIYQETCFYCDFTRPFTYLPWNYNTALAYAGADGKYRPMLGLLAYRDGHDDYLYLHTLDLVLADGRGSPEARARAEEFRTFLRKKIRLDPRTYHAEVVDAQEGTSRIRHDEWNGVSIQRYRWFIATLIADLEVTK